VFHSGNLGGFIIIIRETANVTFSNEGRNPTRSNQRCTNLDSYLSDKTSTFPKRRMTLISDNSDPQQLNFLTDAKSDVFVRATQTTRRKHGFRYETDETFRIRYLISNPLIARYRKITLTNHHVLGQLLQRHVWHNPPKGPFLQIEILLNGITRDWQWIAKSVSRNPGPRAGGLPANLKRIRQSRFG